MESPSKEQEVEIELTEKKEKALIFVEHIEDHLKEGDVVLCKICGKSIDEIFAENI